MRPVPTTDSSPRQCSKVGCALPAASTLTYVYSEQTVVVGPLVAEPEPHVYDLCADHTARLTAPRGWQVMRLQIDLDDPTGSVADIAALADAVRDQKAAGPAGNRSTSPAARGAAQAAGTAPRLRLVSGDQEG